MKYYFRLFTRLFGNNLAKYRNLKLSLPFYKGVISQNHRICWFGRDLPRIISGFYPFPREKSVLVFKICQIFLYSCGKDVIDHKICSFLLREVGALQCWRVNVAVFHWVYQNTHKNWWSLCVWVFFWICFAVLLLPFFFLFFCKQ